MFLLGFCPSLVFGGNSYTFPAFSTGTIHGGGAAYTKSLDVSALPAGTEYLFAVVTADFTSQGAEAYSNTIRMELNNGGSTVFLPQTSAAFGGAENRNSTTLRWAAMLAKSSYVGGDNLTVKLDDGYGDGGAIYASKLDNVRVTLYPAATGALEISGNVGEAGATLSYTDGTAKTVTADGAGSYSLPVAYNWSGTVTPSKAGVTFVPTSRAYTSVTASQTGQNFVGYSAPVVAVLNPSHGPASGGTVVMIGGANFTGATAVRFGGGDVASFTVNSATSITTTAPAGEPGNVGITVTTPGGTSTPATFTYDALPMINVIDPASGPVSGGTVVSIGGTAFTGATAVSFGGVSASSFTLHSDSTITATSPAGNPGRVDVTVTCAGTTSNGVGFIYDVPVTGVDVPTAGIYATDATLRFAVTFDAAVAVTGVPTLPLTVGATARAASYVGGSGSEQLVFEYTVQPGDDDSDGIVVGPALSLNGGAINAAGPHPALLELHNVGSTSGVLVDTVGRTYTGWAAAGFSAAELANPDISGSGADPDGSGVTNLMRYALDLPARGPVDVDVFAEYDGTTSPATLELAFPVRAFANDLSYTVQSSSDLVSWEDVASYSANGAARIEVCSTAVPAGTSRLFLRLHVSLMR